MFNKRSFIIFMPHEVSPGLLNQRGGDRHACKRGEMHMKF